MLTGNTIADEQKEVCAILVMRTMLEDFCKDTGKNFEQELLRFAHSKTYDALFDFETRLWAEGPDYLRDTYEAEIKRTRHTIADILYDEKNKATIQLANELSKGKQAGEEKGWLSADQVKTQLKERYKVE